MIYIGIAFRVCHNKKNCACVKNMAAAQPEKEKIRDEDDIAKKIAEFFKHDDFVHCAINLKTKHIYCAYNMKMQNFFMFELSKTKKKLRLYHNPIHVDMTHNGTSFRTRLLISGEDKSENYTGNPRRYKYYIPSVDEDDEDPNYEIFIRVGQNANVYHLFDFHEGMNISRYCLEKYARIAITKLTAMQMEILSKK